MFDSGRASSARQCIGIWGTISAANLHCHHRGAGYRVAKGPGSWNDIAQNGLSGGGIDWNISPEEGRSRVGRKEKVLQGAISILVICTPIHLEQIKHRHTQKMLDAFGGRHIANLVWRLSGYALDGKSLHYRQ